MDAKMILQQIEAARQEINRDKVAQIRELFKVLTGVEAAEDAITENSVLVVPQALAIPCPEILDFPFVVPDRIDPTGDQVLIVRNGFTYESGKWGPQ